MSKTVGDALKISAPLSVGNIEQRRPEWAPGARNNLAALQELADGFNREAATIRGDQDLTQSGRFKRTETVARGALAKLAAFEAANVQPLRERVAGLEGSVLKRAVPVRPADAGERLAYELRLVEIRAELRALDPLARAIVYLGTTAPMVIDAIETAPPSLVLPTTPGALPSLAPFVDPERVAAAQLARVREANPDAARELEDLQMLADTYAAAAATMRTEILTEVPGARDTSMKLAEAAAK